MVHNYIKYPDINRIDFLDYLNSYTDLQQAFGTSVDKARSHWLESGRFEGRNIKINNVDYNLVEIYIKKNYTNFNNILQKVNLITSLYNEPDPIRRREYICTLKLNIQNPLIEKIYIYYDLSTDENDELAAVMKHSKVEVKFYYGRPSFAEMINFSNTKPDDTWVISNADIIHTPTLSKIFDIDLAGKVLALTRWDFVSEETITPYHAFNKINTISQDAWVYNTPFDFPASFSKIELGTIACDCHVSQQLKITGVETYNPCMDIQTLHLHLRNSRTQDYGNSATKILNDKFNGTWPTVNTCDIDSISI